MVQYGVSLPFDALGHAVLAISALDLPPSQFQDRVEHHKRKAWRALSHKLDDPATLGEGDGFAACILADVAWKSGADAELSIHIPGCLSILEALSARSAETPLSYTFVTFTPYVLDWIYHIGTFSHVAKWPLTGGPQPLPRRQSTFRQRLQYFEELCRTRSSWDVRQSGPVQAVHDILAYLIMTLTHCIYAVSNAEKMHIFVRDLGVDDVLRNVVNELHDPDFQKTLATMQSSLEAASMTTGTLELQVAMFLIQQMRCTCLILRILQAPSILSGLYNPEVISMGETLVGLYRLQSPAAGVMNTFYGSGHSSGLSFAGISLRDGQLSERMTSVRKKVLTSRWYMDL